MTNNEKYIAQLKAEHPELPQKFFDFCAVLGNYDKASHYADLLATCTNYDDIAEKVIRPMYVNDDIDEVRVKSEKFLALLLPLACLPVEGKAHAAVHHVKKVVDDKMVNKERQEIKEQRKQLWKASQLAKEEGQALPFSRITIEITDTESMRLFIDFLQSAGTRYKVEKDKYFHGPLQGSCHEQQVVIEDSPQWLLAACTDLQTRYPEALEWHFGYISDWITRSDITLAELIELISQECIP